MAEVILEARPRQNGRHAVRELRAAELVPCVVYGAGRDNEPIAVNARELHKALVTAGTGLISLQLQSGAPVQVLAREVQHHPVKHYVQHVDFLAVSMTERLKLHVPIALEGTAPALARAGVVMVRNMDSVEIECLARDIPQHLVADITKLETEDDTLYVRDLAVPPGVEVLADGDLPVVSMTLSRAEAVEEAAAAEGGAAEPEVVGRGKKEEEEAD